MSPKNKTDEDLETHRGEVVQSSVPDPYDLENMELTTNVIEADVSIKTELGRLPVGKPSKQVFFRVRSDTGFKLRLALIRDDETGGWFIVQKGMQEALRGEWRPYLVVLYMTKSGNLGWWPLKLPTEDGFDHSFSRSAREAAKTAETRWVRLKTNMPAQCYDFVYAEGTGHEPQWPDMGWKELLAKGFPPENMIASLDHPLAKKLLGLA